MKILRGLDEFIMLLKSGAPQLGCLADTGFLYALAYKDDRLFEYANDIHDLLVEFKVPIYSNVISRMEFIDLIFRKQVTIGSIHLFESATDHAFHKPIYNTLKEIRDKNTAYIKRRESFKVDEGRLKKLRRYLVDVYGVSNWSNFCNLYTEDKLFNEWVSIEEDLGFNFVEIMEGQKSDLFNDELKWSDMVKLMGKMGLRAPDAMIANLFDKSKFELLITSDSDFENCFSDPIQQLANKSIFILQ